MRRLITSAAALVALAVVGCGDTTVNTAPLSDEQKKAIQEDDKRVFDEEGGKQGKAGAGKPTPGKK